MKRFLWVFLLFHTLFLTAQNDTISRRRNIRSHYLEDQLFFNISYIALRNLYPGINQQGFSHSVSFGFIRDIPVNLRRNIGFGIGLGYERNVYFQNLRIWKDEHTGNIQYRILDRNDFISNSFVIKKIIMPVEIRLRGSTADKFKFWRVYAGVTAGYTLSAFSEFENRFAALRYRRLNDIPSKFQFGLHLYAGYGDINGYIYYGLNDLFSPQVKINNEHVRLSDIRFGVTLTFL